ncbi:MAG: protein kinase domain-containing protein [Rhodoferax sp.]
MADVPPFSQSRALRTVSLPLPSTLGRFELRQRLGQGAQSVVYQAFDPRLEREVAIKLMRPDALGSDQAVAQWLHEARSAGRVIHPNIIPLFEADMQDQCPYLVFEYVQGRTLAQHLKAQGPLPPAQAVALAMDVLDALAAAHAAGVVHRDLKPSNILVDKAGRARVMDFGIAARISQPGGGALPISAGTPGYLSPEAATGAVPATSMDIFGVGLVLAEMLCGQPLVAERDPYRAVYRAMHEQLVLPPGLDVDEPLRALVQRALARDPLQRFSDAPAFLAALEAWSRPGAATPSAPSRGTLEFLLRRMRHKTDFPALSEAVVRIQSMASSETESIHSVTSEILKDVALTHKLLRVVNSAQYSRGGGSISTVSRAVSLVGFNGIRNMALSLVLLEHMNDKAHAALLKEEFLRSLMAGTIGAELCANPREAEEAFIGALFQNLGRLLVLYYFPEEAQAIRALVHRERAPMTELQAAVDVLGMGLDELGAGIARAWGLHRSIVRCIEKPQGDPPAQAPSDPVERMRWLALAANEMADAMLHSPAEQLDTLLDQITQRYTRVAALDGKDHAQALGAARRKLVDLARAMDLHVAPKLPAARLLQMPLPQAPAAAQGHPALDDLELHATQPLQAPPSAVQGDAPVRMLHRPKGETLAAGIQDITNAMVEDFKLTDVLRMILETMYRALELDRVLFCMRDPKTDLLTGRFGLGQGVDAHVKTFCTHLRAGTPDLFALVCNKGVDTFISDTAEPRVAQRLPAWYRSGLNAPTFLLLPLQLKGAPFGLIYADKTHPSSLELDERELSLLRTLRNQAVMAFKQASA